MAWFYIRDGQRNEWELNERLPAGADLFHVDFLNQFVWAAAERAHMSHRIPLTKDNLLTRNMGGVDLLECEVKSLADPTLDSSLGIISIGDDIQSTATLGRWLDAIYLADGIADGSLDRQWADIDARPAKPVHGDIIDSIFFDNVRDYLININDAAYAFRIERYGASVDYLTDQTQNYSEWGNKLAAEESGDKYIAGVSFAPWLETGWPGSEDDRASYFFLGSEPVATPEQYEEAWQGTIFIGTWPVPTTAMNALGKNGQFGLYAYVIFEVQQTNPDSQFPIYGLVPTTKYGFGAYFPPSDVHIPLRVGELKAGNIHRAWSGRLETWYNPFDGWGSAAQGWQWDDVEGRAGNPPPKDSRIFGSSVLYQHTNNVEPIDILAFGFSRLSWGGIGLHEYETTLRRPDPPRPPMTHPDRGEQYYVRHFGQDVTIYLEIEPHFKYPSLPKGA